ncbi:capsid protein [Giant panda associated gemycircularvirus]|nr:capsid protein [Giant panda associated gemycircularvirus]
MARKYLSRYRPKYSGAYRGRRPVRAKVSPRRRSYGKKKYGGRKMSSKKILNVTSRKKRDDMSPYYVTYKADGTLVAGPGSITAIGTQTGASSYNNRVSGYIWCPTARDFSTSSGGGKGTTADLATRTASICYMRGLKERIEIQTSSGAPWQWRRICFRFRGNLYGQSGQNSQAGNYQTHVETSNGYRRLTLQFIDASATGNMVENSLTSLIFRGSPSSDDWYDYMNAPLDPTRVDICYDKQTVISSGNTQGKVFRKNFWMPMNKNLVYDDDETGGTEQSSYYSMHGKQGMGDYYVVDFFKSGLGSTSSDILVFEPQSTLYWHEK